MARGESRNPVTVLLLTLVTCGLYGFYWFTQIAGELNDALGEERFSPVKDIALSMVTCGLWFLWLEWRLANAAVELQQSRGLEPKLEAWMLFATGLFGLFPFFMQAMLNETWQEGGVGQVLADGGSDGGPVGEPDPAPMADDWVERFEAMVAEMKEHPRISVTHHWVGEPVSEEEFAAVEEELGFELDERITAFYRQADGVQFRWMDKTDKAYVAERDDHTSTERGSYICGDNDDAMGVIDILPFHETFVDGNYEGHTWSDWMADSDTEFRGKDYNLMEFSKGIRPFDRFSFYNSTAFYIGDGEPGTTVIMGDDHDATFTGSRITDFASYLEFALAHRGMPQPRRDEFIEWGGHKKARLVFEREDFEASPLPLDDILPDTSHLLTDEDIESDQPVRVSVQTGTLTGGVRGEVIEVGEAPTKPAHWDRSTEFVKVGFDLGPTGYVVRPGLSVLRREDVYERAIEDPAGFFEGLLAASAVERVEQLAKIGAGDASSTGYTVDTDDGTIDFLVNAHSPRYIALVDALDTDEAVGLLLGVVESLIEDGLDTGLTVNDDDDEAYVLEEFENPKNVTHGKLVGTICSAVGALLMESYNEEAYDSVRAKFGDDLADRLAAVVSSLEGEKLNMRDYPMVEFFAAAIDSFPGSTELQVRKISMGYTSDQFGLDEDGLPVLSG